MAAKRGRILLHFCPISSQQLVQNIRANHRRRALDLWRRSTVAGLQFADISVAPFHKFQSNFQRWRPCCLCTWPPEADVVCLTGMCLTASQYLARTAKYLWRFITSHTDSLGRKLFLVLPLRLTTPQARVQHHVAFGSASVLSCSVWRPAVIRLLYDRQSQFRTSHKVPPRSFSKLGGDQINLEAHSSHRFTWQMRPASLHHAPSPARIDPSAPRMDVDTIILRPGKLQ